MIEKKSGKVSYAVLSFGGFLGIGHDHYPLPWPELDYDTSLGGYWLDITKDQLTGAPKYGQNDKWDWEDRKSRQRRCFRYTTHPLSLLREIAMEGAHGDLQSRTTIR